jgi:hypothetical protein
MCSFSRYWTLSVNHSIAVRTTTSSNCSSIKMGFKD